MRSGIAGGFALAAVALLALLLLAQPAEARSFSLPSADVRVVVVADGSLLIEEDITFAFSGSFRGAFREIPLSRGEEIDQVEVAEAGRAYAPGAPASIGSNGPPNSFGMARTSRGVRVVWHYGATNETRTFTLRYRLRGLTAVYDDVVDVNLKVWGDEWNVRLGRLTAQLVLPQRPVAGPFRGFGHPAWVRGDVTLGDDRIELRAQSIDAGQFVELRALFSPSLLTSAAGARRINENALGRLLAAEARDAARFERDADRIAAWRDQMPKTVLVLLALGLGPAFLVIGAIWWRYGREPATGYEREYEQEPPSDLAPALVPPLLRQDRASGSHEFTATLFDLIRRGYYETTPANTEHRTWGGLRSELVADLELSKPEEGPGGGGEDTLAPWEKPVADVVDSILATGPERLSRFRSRITSDRAANAPRFTSFKAQVRASIGRRRWYLDGGKAVLTAAVVTFAVVGGILIAIGVHGWRDVFPRWSDVVLVALGGCLIANAAALFFTRARASVWRRRHRRIALEADRWDAFRRYLTDFPRLADAPPAALEIWERYLVYGIALGIADRVLQGAQLHMSEELAETSVIYWI
ncbi:MAG: DUF2207 family protein, partial [Gaiellaceae bacterium]